MTTPTNDRQTSERERLAEECEQLRAERDEAFRMSRCECGTNECCANLVKHSAELAALRAENEALRTVTHTCTECFEGQIQNFDGTFRTCEHCGGTTKRQSFIRSKESRCAPE